MLYQTIDVEKSFEDSFRYAVAFLLMPKEEPRKVVMKYYDGAVEEDRELILTSSYTDGIVTITAISNVKDLLPLSFAFDGRQETQEDMQDEIDRFVVLLYNSIKTGYLYGNDEVNVTQSEYHRFPILKDKKKTKENKNRDIIRKEFMMDYHIDMVEFADNSSMKKIEIICTTTVDIADKDMPKELIEYSIKLISEKAIIGGIKILSLSLVKLDTDKETKILPPDVFVLESFNNQMHMEDEIAEYIEATEYYLSEMEYLMNVISDYSTNSEGFIYK